MGTGSALAHRAVDSVMGPRTMTVQHEGAPAESGAASAAAPAAGATACGNQMKAFTACLDSAEGDIARCQFYHDALQQCKRAGY
jgi:hypothetical protein